MRRVHVLALILSIALFGCKSGNYADLGDGVFADIQTTKGAIVVKLEYQKTPITVANFISLAEGENTFVSDEYKGKKFYDGLIFHRVMKDFMIQGGDPLGTGMGNPGYKFMDEFNDSLVHDKKGILSMANSGPGTNGSQFFITHKETPWLNSKHTVFGEVVVGIGVVDSIASVVVAPGNKPVDSILVNTIKIIRNGKDAKKFDGAAIMTDYFAKEGERLAALEKEKQEKMAALVLMRADFAAALSAQKAKAKTLPSGLKILSLVDGEGEKPKFGTQVLVKYAGYLEDGTLFDSNYEDVAQLHDKFDERRKQAGLYNPTPMDYSPEAQLFAGFREALLTMKVGDKIRAFLPSHLGLGEQGSPGVIPPNADLVFDLEIMGLAQ